VHCWACCVALFSQIPCTKVVQKRRFAVSTPHASLPVASIQNRAGNFVAPSPAGATAAIEAFGEALAKDARTAIVDPPASAKDAYPISGLTFLLAPKDASNAEERRVLRDFMQYTITTGQDSAESLFYAKLPKSIQQQDLSLLAGLTADGQPLN